MESFSQRKGIKPVRTEIQRESMDDDLRTGLWNALYRYYFEKQLNYYVTGEQYELIRNLWITYFKRPVDELGTFDSNVKYIRDYFNECRWYDIYGLIEIISQTYCDTGIIGQFRLDESKNEKFREECNSILESNLSAYRFVGDKIVEITSKQEITEIESALQIPISEIQVHLNSALKHFSNRANPDYRNSIKESISAVESLCKIITGDKKSTLGQALEKIDTKLKIGLHDNLKEAFKNIYTYTSDAGGIRHALKDGQNPSEPEDARFMLVACSAFINYLKEKASKAGINLQ